MRMNAGGAAKALRFGADEPDGRCVLSIELPVSIIRRTPASTAACTTAARSSSKLSCARLRPISIVSGGMSVSLRASRAVLSFGFTLEF